MRLLTSGDQGRAEELTFKERSLLSRAHEFMRMDRLRLMTRFSSLACADSGEGCTSPGVVPEVPCSWFPPLKGSCMGARFRLSRRV